MYIGLGGTYNGNVGIGTTAPAHKLGVNGVVNTRVLSVYQNSVSSGDYAAIGFQHSSTNAGAGSEIRNYNPSLGNDADLAFWVMNGAGTLTEYMRIKGSTGNVGIGTASPEGILSINSGDGNNDWIQIGKETATASKYIGTATGASFGANSGFSGIEFGPPAGTGEGYLAFHTHDSGISSGERMRIDKSGSVGIGTTTPGAKLHEYHGVTYAAGDGIRSEGYYPNYQWYSTFPSSNSHNWALVSPWSADNTLELRESNAQNGDPLNAGTTRVTFQTGGNVGIGTTNPSYAIHQSGYSYATPSLTYHSPAAFGLDVPGGNAEMVMSWDAGAGWGYYIQARSYSSAAEPISLNPAGGNVGIGQINPATYKLEVVGDAGKTVGGTAWENQSDARLKNILGELKGTALDKISQMHPIKYEWNALHQQLYGTSTDTVMYGFIAQEMMKVVPEFITLAANGYYMYNPSGFEAILTAGIQEQQQQISPLYYGIGIDSAFGTINAVYEY